MRVTYAKVFGPLGGIIALVVTVVLVLNLGTPGQSMNLGLAVLVIAVTWICYGIGEAIGTFIDNRRSKQPPADQSK